MSQSSLTERFKGLSRDNSTETEFVPPSPGRSSEAFQVLPASRLAPVTFVTGLPTALTSRLMDSSAFLPSMVATSLRLPKPGESAALTRNIAERSPSCLKSRVFVSSPTKLRAPSALRITVAFFAPMKANTVAGIVASSPGDRTRGAVSWPMISARTGTERSAAPKAGPFAPTLPPALPRAGIAPATTMNRSAPM